MKKGRLRLEDAGLIAYSHGSYVALQHKELGTFGYSVMKPEDPQTDRLHRNVR